MSDDNLILALKLLSVFGLVALNGFFVATEFALVSVRKSRMETLAAEGNRRALPVLAAVKDLDGYIAATQLGITISSIGLGWIGEPALAVLLDPFLESVLPEWAAVVSTHTISFIIAFTIITFLHVIFGELAPKSVALQYPETTSMLVTRPTTIFLRIFRPAIIFMNGTGQAFLRLVGIRGADVHSQIYSEEELRLLIEASSEGGEITDSEEAIIRRAFTFHDQTAEDIMVPRTELVTIPHTATLSELRELVAAHPYSRYPIWTEDLDQITHILHVRDLMPVLLGTQSDPDINIMDLARPVHAVPESVRIDELLDYLRRERTRLAIVIDEHGGTEGMVTLGDIMERIIGEVPDEWDHLAGDFTIDADGSTLVDGLSLLSDVNEYFGLEIEVDEFSSTIGGFVFSELGRRPDVGDIVPVGPYEIQVEELDGLRIAEVRFVPTESAVESSAS